MNFSHPALNAGLNTLSFIFLCMGRVAIAKKNVLWHRLFMMGAFGASTIFLVSYLVYHFQHGSTRFLGQGWIRPVYFTLLLTHTVLAVVIVPLILKTLRMALKGDFLSHQRWARWTWPLWMYVSVTGVVIYWMLYQ